MSSEWQPIETAPRDGKPILGWCKWEEAAAVVYWHAAYRGSERWWNLLVCGSHAEDGEWTPTHWMPLPEPPK